MARVGRIRARIDGSQPPEPHGLTDRELRRALNAAEHPTSPGWIGLRGVRLIGDGHRPAGRPAAW